MSRRGIKLYFRGGPWTVHSLSGFPMTLRRTLIVVPLVLVGVATLLVAGDWWISLPADAEATYVGRDECRRCHEQECDLWKNSDHDKSMAPATLETVLGDFNDIEFIHIAFEDIPKLSDGDVQTVLKHVTTNQWALALYNVPKGLQENIFDRMAEQHAGEIAAAMENFVSVRPCDSVIAQNEIADVIRGLEREGKVKIDFAVKTRFFREGEKFLVTTDDSAGAMKTFEIPYVFGVCPLQQYLIEFPGGRMQCLPIAWDTTRKAWFHLYPTEPIPAGDELHWTGAHQNWNYMCAACHSTNLRKNFDLEANAYDTTWSEINVSCETCHGPGSLHVKLADAKSLFWDRRIGYGLPDLKSEDSRVEIETCAPCHVRRRVVYPGFEAGGKFLDTGIPVLLDNPVYYPDGQILDEDYVYGSFIQSKMYEKGVRCTDCHDPHSVRVKHTAPGDPWDKPPDNRLCTDCHMETHPAGKYDTPAHHHHPDASKPGTKCVECHMPETSYMVADPRRDHSMRSPRPDLTIALGIPNACNNCHNDKSKGETAQWAEEKLEQWYGKRELPAHFAHAIAAGRQQKIEGLDALDKVTRNKDQRAAVRAGAILLLGQYPTEKGHAASIRGLEDPEALVRVAAVQSLEGLPPDRLYRLLAPMLRDSSRAVRAEAARLLSPVPRHFEKAQKNYEQQLAQWKKFAQIAEARGNRPPDRPKKPTGSFDPQDRKTLDAALAEYVAGQENLGDQAPAHLNMAVVYYNLGRFDKAEQEYLTAIRLNPKFVHARNNLAMLYSELGRRPGAMEQLREVIRLLEKRVRTVTAPALIADAHALLGRSHYSLGLLLAEKEEDLGKAAGELKAAAEMLPQNPQIHYNYGLALQKLGHPDGAEKELLKAYELEPRDPDYLHALAILYTQQKSWARAIMFAEELVRRRPDVPRFHHLLHRAKREAAATKPPE